MDSEKYEFLSRIIELLGAWSLGS